MLWYLLYNFYFMFCQKYSKQENMEVTQPRYEQIWQRVNTSILYSRVEVRISFGPSTVLSWSCSCLSSTPQRKCQDNILLRPTFISLHKVPSYGILSFSYWMLSCFDDSIGMRTVDTNALVPRFLRRLCSTTPLPFIKRKSAHNWPPFEAMF
jgi:hypothetical protein